MRQQQEDHRLPPTALPTEPDIDGRHYYHVGTGALVTRGERDNPPGYYEVSSPDPNDETGKYRLFWIFVGIAFVIGTGLWALYEAGLLDDVAKTL